MRTNQNAPARNERDDETALPPKRPPAPSIGRRSVHAISSRRNWHNTMKFIITITLVLSAATAIAQPLMPIMRPSGGCPHGYYSSAGYCMPSASAQPAIVPAPRRCPFGWTASAGVCKRAGQQALGQR